MRPIQPGLVLLLCVEPVSFGIDDLLVGRLVDRAVSGFILSNNRHHSVEVLGLHSIHLKLVV